MKITLNKDRKLLRIETDEFSIKLNGKTNTAYRDMLAPMGIELQFQDDEADAPLIVGAGKDPSFDAS